MNNKKGIFLRLRIFLLMLAFGLASVPFFNSAYEKLTEIPVNLPQVESDNPIYAFPRYEKEIPIGGGSHSECDSRHTRCFPNEFGGFSYLESAPLPDKPNLSRKRRQSDKK